MFIIIITNKNSVFMKIEKTKQKNKSSSIAKYMLVVVVGLLLLSMASAQSTNTTVVTSSVCPVISSFGGFGVFQLIGGIVILIIGGFAMFVTYKRQVEQASEKDTPINYNTMLEIGVLILVMMVIFLAGVAYVQGQLHCPVVTPT